MSTIIHQRIGDYGIVPVLVFESDVHAIPVADALCRAGLPVAEVTFRTAAAASVIRQMRDAHPDMLIGAGTVITTDQVDQAMEAGAQCIISPSFNPKVVAYCAEREIPVFPNCNCNRDIEEALALGVRCFKYFPVFQVGGIPSMAAVRSIYGADLTFMPTGGINPDNAEELLREPSVLAIGGSWIAPKGLISAGDYGAIEKNARQAMELSLGFGLAGVGMPCGAATESLVRSLAEDFNLEVRNQDQHYRAGGILDVFAAGNNSITLATNSLDRAVAYLRRLGLAEGPTPSGDEQGRIKLKSLHPGVDLYLTRRR